MTGGGALGGAPEGPVAHRVTPRWGREDGPCTWCGPSQSHWSTASDEEDKKKAVGIWNADWKFINDGDGFWSAIDPNDANIRYAESQGGYIARIKVKAPGGTATAIRKIGVIH